MTLDPKQHPTSEVLELYSFGRLSGSNLERIENHLFVCEHCQNELVSIDCSIREIKQACETLKRQAEPTRAGFWTRVLAIPTRPVFAGAFAAVALAIAIPVSMYQTGNSAPALVRLDTLRGAAEGGATLAPAKRPLHLQLNMPEAPGTPTYRAEIVNSDGSRVWSGSPNRQTNGLAIDVDKSLSAGLYWVRLYNRDMAVREFGLELR